MTPNVDSSPPNADRSPAAVAGTHHSSTMAAIRQSTYGGPEVLELATVDVPTPAADEVLVRVHAASVNPADWHHMRGDPYFMRLKFGLRYPKVRGRGFDLAGRVDAVGDDVTAFEPGEEVYGCIDFDDAAVASGSLAEYATVPVENLANKPTTLSFEEAASLPLAGLTALQGLRQGGVGEGTSVLINGASGGVGTIAVQIADALGAEVTGVCSTRNVDLIRSLGADHVIDYTSEELATSGRRYDCVIDWVGNRSLRDLRTVLAPEGTLVLSGGQGGHWIGPLPKMVAAVALDRLTGQSLETLTTSIDADDLAELAELLDDGTVRPVIDHTYSLDEAAEAIRYVETGRARGKVAVAVAEGV